MVNVANKLTVCNKIKIHEHFGWFFFTNIKLICWNINKITLLT